MDEPIDIPAALPPLGPGESDPTSPASESVPVARGPLGPGDDDPRSPVRIVGDPVTRGPLGAGESTGPNPDDEFHFLAPLPAGPGDPASGPRHVVRIPKRQPPVVADSEDKE